MGAVILDIWLLYVDSTIVEAFFSPLTSFFH